MIRFSPLRAKLGVIVLIVKKQPRRGRPPQADRPLIITDAVLRVLADEGSKGLSHRRVDREAGLPIGSTAHQAPTRCDLFMVAAQRLNEMMIDDIERFASRLQDKGQITPEILAKEIVGFWRTTITPEDFYRLRAEAVILFSREFHHEVHIKFKPQLEEFKKFWTRIFTDLGAPKPLQAALEITAWTRGIFNVMAACEGEMNEDEYEMIETWLVKMVNSFLVERDGVATGIHAGGEGGPRRARRGGRAGVEAKDLAQAKKKPSARGG
jgi:hypothetical protein